MPITVGHILTATTPDDTNFEIRPTHWNSAHAITLNISGSDLTAALSNSPTVSFGLSGNQLTASALGGGNPNVSAGTTSNNLGSIVFSNANNVSFGLNGSTITGSVAAGAGSINISAGTTSNTFTNIVFSNSNGVSFGLNGSTVTGSVATSSVISGNNVSISTAGSTITINASGNYSAGTSSGSVNQLVFSNSNGVSFGLSGSTLTASASGAGGGVQSFYALGNTTQNSSTTLSVVSFNAIGGGTVGYSNGSVQLSIPVSSSLSAGANITITPNGSTISIIGAAGGAQNVSAGTTSNNLASVVFSNSNGVSFGLNGSTITASAAAGGAGISAGTQSVNTGTMVFSNSNNITFGMSGSSRITASYAYNVSAGTTSGNLNAVTFSNSNGVSFGLNAGTLTGSVAAQTNQTVGLYGLGNTTQNSSTTLDARTISYNGLGALTVGFSNGSVQLSAPASSSLVGGANITISTAGSTVTIIGATVAGQPVNFSAGTTSNSLGTVVFANSNRMSFGLNGSTITVGDYTTNFAILPADVPLTQVSAPGVGSLSIQYVEPRFRISATRMDALFNWTHGSTTTSNTMAIALTAICGIYTLNGSTLSSLSSGSTQTTYSYASNNSGYITDAASVIRPVSVPVNIDMAPGGYYIAFGWSSAATSIGAATTALAQTMSVLGYAAGYTVNNYADWGNATATSRGYIPCEGVYSAAISTIPPTISQSAINQTGANIVRANIGLLLKG